MTIQWILVKTSYKSEKTFFVLKFWLKEMFLFEHIFFHWLVNMLFAIKPSTFFNFRLARNIDWRGLLWCLCKKCISRFRPKAFLKCQVGVRVIDFIIYDKVRQEAFRERRHIHFCDLWPCGVTLTCRQGQENWLDVDFYIVPWYQVWCLRV